MKLAGWVWLLASGLCLISPTALAERRALVIGNDDYVNIRPRLEKAVADARAFSNKLKDVGFRFLDQETEENLDQEEMLKAIGTFSDSLGKDDEVVVYFAGHGTDQEGNNYLLPVDFPNPSSINSLFHLQGKSIRLGTMLEQISKKSPRFSLVIIDACRNNPFSQLKTRSGREGGGLADEKPPEGMMLLYSAAPGKVALDYIHRPDEDNNGVFMRALLPALKQPGLEIRNLIIDVRTKVKEMTKGKGNQFPNYHDLLDGRFCFVGPCNFAMEGQRHWEIVLQQMQTERAALAKARAAAHDVELAASRLKEALTEEKNAIKAQKDADIRKAQEAVDQANRQLKQAKEVQRQADEALKARQGNSLSGPKSPILVAGGNPPGKEVVSPDSTYRDPTTGMEFVRIPKGCYEMGSPSSEEDRDDDEGPVHEVCVESFWLGKYEVTNREYRKWKNWHVSGNAREYNLNGDSQPVVNVNWEEAHGYGEWLSGKGNGEFRLPTEAEWEYATRAGTKFSRYWGDGEKEACQYENVADRTRSKAMGFWMPFNCDDGYTVTAPVGRFKPNGFGLYDMLGNAWEWTADWYENKYYADSPKNNQTGPSSGSARVFRGGNWDSDRAHVRSADRFHNAPGNRYHNLGFRLARTYP